METECLCSRPAHSLLTIAANEEYYTEMFVDTADKDVDNQMTLISCGEGCATFAPKFCPFCGRKIRDKSLFQYICEDFSQPVMLDTALYKKIKECKED